MQTFASFHNSAKGFLQKKEMFQGIRVEKKRSNRKRTNEKIIARCEQNSQNSSPPWPIFSQYNARILALDIKFVFALRIRINLRR